MKTSVNMIIDSPLQFWNLECGDDGWMIGPATPNLYPEHLRRDQHRLKHQALP